MRNDYSPHDWKAMTRGDGKEWIETRLFTPRGPGDVIAFSKPAQKEMRINWKYVAEHPDVYTSWRELESHERS